MYSKIIMVLLALTTIGLTSNAYADDHCVRTEQETPTGMFVNMVCQWNLFIPNDGGDTEVIPDPDPEPTIECIEPQVLYDGQCVFPQKPTMPTEEPDDVREPDVNDSGDLDVLEVALILKDKYCNLENPLDWQGEVCDALKEATTCESGLREARGTQTYRIYITTNMVFSIWTHWDLDTKPDLKNLKLANEECRGQMDTLEPLLFGPEYDNRADADEVPDLTHTERAADIFQPIHPLPQTDATIANAIKVAEDAKCANRNFISSWIDWGCPHARAQYYEGVGIDVGGENVVEHLKYLENQTAYQFPVIKGWFKVGEGDWVISLP